MDINKLRNVKKRFLKAQRKLGELDYFTTPRHILLKANQKVDKLLIEYMKCEKLVFKEQSKFFDFFHVI